MYVLQDREATEGINTQYIKMFALPPVFALNYTPICSNFPHNYSICQEPNTRRLVRMHQQNKKVLFIHMFFQLLYSHIWPVPSSNIADWNSVFLLAQTCQSLSQFPVISVERAVARLQCAAVIDLGRFENELSDFGPRDATCD